MLQVKKNKDLEVKKFQMSCDTRPDKLNACLDWNFANLIVGGPGSGKSNLWLNLITRRNKFYWRMFDNIYIFSPSLNTIKKEIKIPSENMIDGFDEERLEEIIENARNREPDEHTLIILDDVVVQLSRNLAPLLAAIYNRRHLGLSVMVITQKYNKVPLELRVAMSDIMMFNNAKKELDALFTEFVNIERKLFDKMVELVFDKKHNFLYIRTNEPTDNKYYKNFNKIELKT
jgi:hypothetical protein